MKNQKEYEKRCKAIQLHKEGYGFSEVPRSRAAGHLIL
jgi:hypothetical protein